MITTEAALYGSGSGTTLLAGLRPPTSTCSCGQELPVDPRHCPRCGCCLS